MVMIMKYDTGLLLVIMIVIVTLTVCRPLARIGIHSRLDGDGKLNQNHDLFIILITMYNVHVQLHHA